MAKFITYKSDVISGSIMQVPSIVADLTGTASYGLYFVTAAFASNASGSWLSSSFNLPSSSTETVIGFDPVGVPAIYTPPSGSYLGINYGGDAWPYLTIKNGKVGWTTPQIKNAYTYKSTDNEMYFGTLAVPVNSNKYNTGQFIEILTETISVGYLTLFTNTGYTTGST
jgi:hypothetical protein